MEKIEQDDEKLQSICNDTNPASVGRCLQHDYQLKVKDLGILNSNLQSLEKLSTELSGKKDALLKEDDELFGKVTNKLKPGTEFAHTFHEKCITRIDGLIKKTSGVTDKGNAPINSKGSTYPPPRATPRAFERLKIGLFKFPPLGAKQPFK